MNPADLAFLSLWRRPVSSLLAILSLGFGLGLGGWLLNVHEAVFSSIEKREPAIDFILGPKSNGLSILLDGMHLAGRNHDAIDYYLVNTLAQEIEPRQVIPLAHFAECGGIPVVGVEDSFFQRPADCLPPRIAKGRWYNEHVEEVVLGAEAASRTGLDVGDSLVARSIYTATDGMPVWRKQMLVVGIMEPDGLPRDEGIYTEIRQSWDCHMAAIAAGQMRMVKRGRGVTAILVGTDPEKPEQAELIHDKVHVASNAQVVEVGAEIEGLRKLLGQGRQALAGLAVLLILLAVAIASLLFNERFETVKRELGILRALGYSRGQVARAILWEGVFLTSVGISLGMVLERMGHLVTPLLWSPPWLLDPPWPNVTLLSLWGATFLASFAATALPLVRLYRWNAHDALKGM
jgi:putative ABC transport system permease protein